MDNVINLFSRSQVTAAQTKAKTESQVDQKKTPGFMDVAIKNQETQERLKKERQEANKAVLKSYRIK